MMAGSVRWKHTCSAELDVDIAQIRCEKQGIHDIIAIQSNHTIIGAGLECGVYVGPIILSSASWFDGATGRVL